MLLLQIPLKDLYSLNQTIIEEIQHREDKIHLELAQAEGEKFIF